MDLAFLAAFEVSFRCLMFGLLLAEPRFGDDVVPPFGFDGFVAEGPRPSIKDSAIRVVEYVNIV